MDRYSTIPVQENSNNVLSIIKNDLITFCNNTNMLISLGLPIINPRNKLLKDYKITSKLRKILNNNQLNNQIYKQLIHQTLDTRSMNVYGETKKYQLQIDKHHVLSIIFSLIRQLDKDKIVLNTRFVCYNTIKQRGDDVVWGYSLHTQTKRNKNNYVLAEIKNERI